MRLSELSTDKAMDILCELTPYVSNIVTDEELVEELRRRVDGASVASREEMIALALDKVNKLVPIVLKKRKADIFGMLGVLNEKTAEEISKQNIIVTMVQIREAVKDKELIDFFKSCVGSEGSE